MAVELVAWHDALAARYGTPLTATIPAERVAGDMLVLLYRGRAELLTVPGWTVMGQTGHTVAYRVSDGTETTATMEKAHQAHSAYTVVVFRGALAPLLAGLDLRSTGGTVAPIHNALGALAAPAAGLAVSFHATNGQGDAPYIYTEAMWGVLAWDTWPLQTLEYHSALRYHAVALGAEIPAQSVSVENMRTHSNNILRVMILPDAATGSWLAAQHHHRLLIGG